MDENINTTVAKTGAATTTTATTKKKITAKELTASDVIQLLKDIDTVVFQGNESNFLTFGFVMCDTLVQCLKLHRYFPDKFNDPDFSEFFTELYAGKYKDYIAAMNKTETSKLIDSAVETHKQIIVGKLSNPLTDVTSNINEILDTLAEEFKGIELDTIKQFINDFAKFAQNNNPETLTDVMLKKAKAENKE